MLANEDADAAGALTPAPVRSTYSSPSAGVFGVGSNLILNRTFNYVRREKGKGGKWKYTQEK
jgi:hypothetical protein